MPLTGYFGPWPLCSKTCNFLCHSQCLKSSNQCPHFKLFSVSTGRNKPPWRNKPESQATADTAASYIHVLSLQRHWHGLASMRAAPTPPLSSYHCRWPCVSAPSRYSDLHPWLFFAPFYPSGRSRIPLRKIRQYYFIDVKTIILFVIISFSEVSILAIRCINHRGPALGTVPSSCYRLEIATAPAEFTRHAAQPSAQCPPVACGGSVLAGFGRPPARTHALGPGTGKNRALPASLVPKHKQRAPTQHTRNPALLLFANPQPHRVHHRLSQGHSSHYRLEIATAPAGFTRPVDQPSAQCPPAASGGSVLAGTRTPTSAHARFRAGNEGRAGADPSHSQPLPAPAASHSPLPHPGALFSLPPGNCHSASASSSLLDCRRAAPGGLEPQ